MLQLCYRRIGRSLEKRPWGVKLIYHSIRHYKLYEFMEALIVAFFFAMIIKTFFFQAFKIPSESSELSHQVFPSASGITWLTSSTG